MNTIIEFLSQYTYLLIYWSLFDLLPEVLKKKNKGWNENRKSEESISRLHALAGLQSPIPPHCTCIHNESPFDRLTAFYCFLVLLYSSFSFREMPSICSGTFASLGNKRNLNSVVSYLWQWISLLISRPNIRIWKV